ncbi:uncharacterized protein NDAI_0J00540 [Naumovozyma dairenensis CBS 421]|uniref:Uncharacterized protein n=1 Tax=Naumovozyma dairenensis (strain ATCC 10597 / BCRC 20456 / CBS 421 / NBRC 0211 / NRRL Y-12639) TaxID=1071378 RepID=G0WGL8_NAUDC|nr:hypothetical protein NDAI_0J00540 [Naumovozyma dairenensis CBS 421]CCD26946.1 hypothetical protein NDAI_0J00540 [Naumovozyma dairenensis CBS 421]
MSSNTNRCLMVRKKALPMNIFRYEYTKLKEKLSFCKSEVYWILDEPNSFKLCPREICYLFKYCLMYHYLKSSTPFYSSVFNTEYRSLFSFYRRKSQLYDPHYYLRDDHSYWAYLVRGPDTGNGKLYFSTTISEEGIDGFNKSVSGYKNEPPPLGFIDLNIFNGEIKASEDMPSLPAILGDNDIEFLPPSDFGPTPCEVLFYHFKKSDAIVYRDLFIVYRNRAIKRGYLPNFDGILKVLLDPPYEIFITDIAIKGEPVNGRKKKYSEVYHDRDVTWAERHCYQRYFVCKFNQMRKGSSSYFTLSFLQEHLEGNPVLRRKNKATYIVSTSCH